MPDFIVNTMFVGDNAISKLFKVMGKDAGLFGDKTAKAFKKASKSGKGFGKIVKGILVAGAIQKGFGALSRGASSVVTQFIEFDDAIVGATVRFKDIGPEAANFNEQLKLLKSTARSAGATTEFTAAQSAKALDFLARAGFSSAEAIGSLNSMINLATATGEDFALVADFSSDLLGAFGLAVDDTVQKTKNLNRLNDVLVKTANTANVTVESMFETMKVGAPIATKFGASLEDVGAMTAILGNAGIKGSQGATAIKNIFTRLAAPTKEVDGALAQLGLTQQDMINKQGKLKNIVDIMELIGDRLKGVAQPKQLGVLKGLFGSFALAGGANVVASIQNVRKFRTELEKASGTSQKTADILRQSLGNQLKALGSAATEFGFKILSSFDKRGKKGIEIFTDAIRKFDVKPIIEGIEVTIKVFKTFFKILQKILDIIKTIIGMFQIFKKSFGAFSELKKVLSTDMPTFKKALTESFRRPSEIIKREESQIIPPNRAEIEARQMGRVEGRIDVAGLPEGSTAKVKNQNSNFELALLGEQ